MAQVGLFTLGISPLGSGTPDHPEGSGYPATGPYTLGPGVGTAGSAASTGGDTGGSGGGPAFSGSVEQFARDALTGSPFYLNYPITGGSITEDLDSLPYATGSYDSDGLTQLDYNLLQQGATGFVGTQLQLSVVTRLGSNASYVERSVNLGRFYVEETRRRAAPGSFGCTFVLAGAAVGTMGATVAGDLTDQAGGTASRLGLMADGRASIEGIAAWLLEQGGRTVRLSDGFLAAHPPTPAYQLDVSGAALGPYSMATRNAVEVLKRALVESGIYIASSTDGTAILTPWPTTTNSPPATTPIRSYGYGTNDHPFTFVGPAPIAKPSAVSVIQQSTLVPTRTVTLSIADGQDVGVVRYFNHFRPTATDSDDHQTLRAQQFAARFVMSGERVEIGTLADGVVHAGDVIQIDASSHGISMGIFLVVRAVHPLGPGSYESRLTCERLAYTWT